MSGACLTKEEKGVVRKAFKRYHAALQVDNDARVILLGVVIYAVALRPVLAKPAPVGGLFVAFQVFLLGLATLWPYALRLWSHDWLLWWRDEFFMGHWLLHHILGPRILVGAGVDFRRNLVSSNPLLFFLGFWLSRPTMWFCGNMVTYRMKFYLFVIFQPIILALHWPEERKACRSSALEYPELTMDSFGSLAAIFRGLTRSSAWSQTTPFDDAMSMCCKVDAFCSVMVALVLPGAVIWYLERQTWREFGRVDPGMLTWEGGPDERQIFSIQKKIRKASKNRADKAVFDGRIVAISYVIAATLWQLLDAPTPSFFCSPIRFPIEVVDSKGREKYNNQEVKLLSSVEFILMGGNILTEEATMQKIADIGERVRIWVKEIVSFEELSKPKYCKPKKTKAPEGLRRSKDDGMEKYMAEKDAETGTLEAPINGVELQTSMEENKTKKAISSPFCSALERMEDQSPAVSNCSDGEAAEEEWLALPDNFVVKFDKPGLSKLYDRMHHCEFLLEYGDVESGEFNPGDPLVLFGGLLPDGSSGASVNNMLGEVVAVVLLKRGLDPRAGYKQPVEVVVDEVNPKVASEGKIFRLPKQTAAGTRLIISPGEWRKGVEMSVPVAALFPFDKARIAPVEITYAWEHIPSGDAAGEGRRGMAGNRKKGKKELAVEDASKKASKRAKRN